MRKTGAYDCPRCLGSGEILCGVGAGSEDCPKCGGTGETLTGHFMRNWTDRSLWDKGRGMRERMDVQRSGVYQESLRILLRRLEGITDAAQNLLEGANEGNVVIFDKAPTVSVLAKEEGLMISIPQLDENCWVEKLLPWKWCVQGIAGIWDDEGNDDYEAQKRVLGELEKEIGLMRVELEKLEL
tara:strand:+ start:576 stop:1127 length:552 start_codon:yes stop_codon:yes gene_type:complete